MSIRFFTSLDAMREVKDASTLEQMIGRSRQMLFDELQCPSFRFGARQATVKLKNGSPLIKRLLQSRILKMDRQ